MMNKKRAEELGHFVRRVETLHAEIADLKQDMKEVFQEAKRADFNLKALRRILSLRKMKDDDRAALQDLVDEYGEALGMWANTPLGQAAESAPSGAVGSDEDVDVRDARNQQEWEDDRDDDDPDDPDDGAGGDNVTRLH